LHDIVGNSLAITLMQLTGARRALQEDVPADANLTDAIDALTEAERIGREAMSDIRRVVGLLNNEPAQTTPQPGAADIGDLVAAFAAAGMRVDYRVVGTLERVSGAVGGGLYRIAQESLTNVAKHAPHSDADVELRVDGQAVSLTVRNDLPARLARRQPPGSGITGMRARAEALGGELRAGPGNGWTVAARIPLAMPRTAGCRPFARERSR
jgi:signal transduction histidine kinase